MSKLTFKAFIKEGTWAVPDTAESKQKLKALLANPLPAKGATKKLYNILGDDLLFDAISDVEEKDPSADVRANVEDRMKQLKISL